MELERGLFAIITHQQRSGEKRTETAIGKPALRLEDHHQVASSRLTGHPVEHDLSEDMQLTLTGVNRRWAMNDPNATGEGRAVARKCTLGNPIGLRASEEVHQAL